MNRRGIIKTIQCSLNVGKHDLERKMKQAQEFLTGKHQVRVQLVLKGRERWYRERGVVFLQELCEDYLDSHGTCAKKPTVDNLTLTYNPR